MSNGVKKVFIIIGLILLILIIGFFCYFFTGKAKPAEKIDFGVTFSKIAAEELGLNWREAYLGILDDLKVKKLRLAAYWPEVEPTEGDFDFKDLDWQIEEAEKKGAEIILAVGRRLPRWPECHIPEWAKNLPEGKQQEKVLTIISKVVNRYKDRDAIKIWQVENEPFLRTFGKCPKLDKEFLEKEIALVRSLDNLSIASGRGRPLMLTESGEFSTWIGAARRADILGTTLYRTVWAKHIRIYIHYPIPAIFYQKKTALIKKLFNIDRIMVSELQAEPWGPGATQELSIREQFKSMNLEKLREITDYTKKAGFSEAYLWGAEWWYWLKTVHNDDSMWNEVKNYVHRY